MLTIHFANRLETLAELLDEQLGAGPVFEADEVIVPSAAMRRHLTLAIARRRGVCANVQFGFLAQWLWRQIGAVVPGVAETSPFAPSALAWRVLHAFGDEHWVARQPRLAGYLAASDALMRYELAQSVATLFDQYVTYRPDWLEAWSLGKTLALPDDDAAARADAAWQGALWRRLAAELGSRHPAEAFTRALQDDGAAHVASGRLPRVVHVFCLPAMPPLHLALLRGLAQCSEVRVYALNPCREYWFEVVDARRLAYLAARGRAVHHEQGQRLLAAWGSQTQSHLGLLVDAIGEGAVDDARFEEPQGVSLLAQVQRSILDLSELAPGSVASTEDDRSIEVHVCHSLTRELEVLQDRLLGLFVGPDAPAPGDILVVTPDLNAAAPLVEAIFGTAPKDRFIPYAVTGRARSRVNPVARVLLDLLTLASSRFPASAVFALLQQPLVARRFGLDAAALERVHGWLKAAGIHWALDAGQRASLGLPALATHSFADGLDRLFLGYALPSGSAEPWLGLLPAGDAEGTEALALGALARAVDGLAQLREAFASPRSGAAWAALLAQALQGFVDAGDDGDELDDLREVQAALQGLGMEIEQAGRDARNMPLPLAVVRAAVERALDDPARGGVPGGGVTFSSLSSLRNLPYRVVCAIGLNDGAFPTAARPLEFDLMARQPRPGDRQRRTDERTLFLDLLLAARETLHLSYTGRSVRDNAPLPPSVLIAELLDWLGPIIAKPPLSATAHSAAQRSLVVTHPLQAFSEDAFRPAADGDERGRSFHREYAEALRHRAPAQRAVGAATELAATAAAERDAHGADRSEDGADDDDGDDEAGIAPAPPFFATPLPAPGDEWLDVTLESLLRFFVNPCRVLLQRRLGIAVQRDADELQDDEPFVGDVPTRSRLAERLLPLLLEGGTRDAARALALAGTELPAGAFGEALLEREVEDLEQFAGKLRTSTQEPCLEPRTLAIDLEVDGRRWHLHAGLADLRASGLVRWRCDDLRARDVLDAWLHHLLLCACQPIGVALRSQRIACNESLTLEPRDDAVALLTELLRLYERGLREPLPFFLRSAWSYVSNGEAAYKALGTWKVSKQNPFGESGDPAYRLALRGRPDPIEDAAAFADFAACAVTVFGPVLAGGIDATRAA